MFFFWEGAGAGVRATLAERRARVDAALARVVAGINLNYSVNNGTKRISGIKDPALKLKVEKYGRTTGHTTGSITTTATRTSYYIIKGKIGGTNKDKVKIYSTIKGTTKNKTRNR